MIVRIRVSSRWSGVCPFARASISVIICSISRTAVATTRSSLVVKWLYSVGFEMPACTASSSIDIVV
jgi:hypothetical protein